MSENATTGGMPGVGGMPPQAAEQQTQQDGTGARPEDGGKPDDAAELREALRKEREIRATAEKRLKAIEEKDLPEAERTKRDLERTTQERDGWRSKAHKADVAWQAAQVGFANPRLAYAALVEFDMLELNADGDPVNVDTALKRLLKDNPGLASAAARPTGDIGQGTRSAAPAGDDMNRLIRRAAGRPG
jgi:hypothetical protein